MRSRLPRTPGRAAFVMLTALLTSAARAATLHVTSTAFEDGARIPRAHTCEGADLSPPLAWSAGPRGTVAYAVIVDDPDAPRSTFVHWLAWNMYSTFLTVGQQDGMLQGRNDFGRDAYGGPCPPVGHGDHRYRFQVYALDAVLRLATGAPRKQVDAAMAGHVLASGTLIGRYRRD